MESKFYFVYVVEVDPSPPPMRRDARRNREHLLTTADELMATRGLGVSYEDISRAAGMGMGTIYRRFPDRQDLIDALFTAHIEAVTRLAQEASTQESAWTGLTQFLQRQLELEAPHRGLGELLRGQQGSLPIVQRAREQMTPLVTSMIHRAVAAGDLPVGVTPADFVAVHIMVGSVLDASRDFAPDLWRRALAVALAGLQHAELPGAPPDDDVVVLLNKSDVP